MTRPRAVEADANRPYRKLSSRTEGPRLLAARFGVAVRVGLVGVSVKAASYSSGLRMSIRRRVERRAQASWRPRLPAFARPRLIM
jgi:hypothetical protein